MPAHQILRHVWFDLKTNDGVLLPPDAQKQTQWWRKLRHALVEWPEARDALVRVLDGSLPDFLAAPLVGDFMDIHPKLQEAGSHWFYGVTNSLTFWRGLLEAGNRGRLVFEFESEEQFTAHRFEYAVPRGVGVPYLIVVTLEPDAREPVVVEHVCDDPAFYAEMKVRFEEDLGQWRERNAAAGEESDEQDDWDFEWSADDVFSGRRSMYERYSDTEVFQYIDTTKLKERVDLSAYARGELGTAAGNGDVLVSWLRAFEADLTEPAQLPLFDTRTAKKRRTSVRKPRR